MDWRMDLMQGDCLEMMAELDDASVDSIVTDPPYGLSFMGKRWDYDVPSVEIWAECLRVLKPGGHLLAFAGTRTQHRMAVRIEDAGFEIRDMIAWVYGSGFPKSLDVSKAIDKRGGAADLTPQIGDAIKAAREARAMTVAECDRLFCDGTTNWSWFEGRPKGQRAPTVETFARIVAAWPELSHLAEAVAEVDREALSAKAGTRLVVAPGQGEDRGATELQVTAPATDAARAWVGWGTALKPALEPVTVARKPLVGTVAQNVLTHGTGALNIDGCRVGDFVNTTPSGQDRYNARNHELGYRPNAYGRDGEASADRRYTEKGGTNSAATPGPRGGDPAGRWPANLIHDGSDEVTALFPQSKGQQGAVGPQHGAKASVNTYGDYGPRDDFQPRGDSGSAARFFYCAKASKKDREEGLEGFDAIRRPNGNKWTDQDYCVARGERPQNAESGPRRNHHPTVKPTDLMRYLCRLVTPPGGIVLDPFMGSGSTGKAAILEGFRFIGIEREADYMDIAEARITAAMKVADGNP